MKNGLLPVIVLLFSFSGCAPSFQSQMPIFRDALNPGEDHVIYIEQHNKTKDQAFVAVHGWLAKNYVSSKYVIQMADKEAGQFIVKAVYSWAYDLVLKDNIFPDSRIPIAVDMKYVLTTIVKDNKIKLQFDTMPIEGAGPPRYQPADKMPEVLAYYARIKDGILRALAEKSDDF